MLCPEQFSLSINGVKRGVRKERGGKVKFCLAFGSLTFILGILFLFAPRLLSKLNNAGNRILFTDEGAFIYRRLCGIILLGAAIFLFWTGIKLVYS